jgi:hypothetical protein
MGGEDGQAEQVGVSRGCARSAATMSSRPRRVVVFLVPRGHKAVLCAWMVRRVAEAGRASLVQYHEIWFQTGGHQVPGVAFDAASNGNAEVHLTAPIKTKWVRCWITRQSVSNPSTSTIVMRAKPHSNIDLTPAERLRCPFTARQPQPELSPQSRQV